MIFDRYKNIAWGISGKSDGSMKLGVEADNDKNRKMFFSARGILPENVVSAELCHGKNVFKAGKEATRKTIERTDGLITAEKELFLTVTIADCLAVFFFDPVKSAIGLAHAGWRGIRDGIIEEMAARMKNEYGVSEKNILIYASPHIQACHFEVQEDVAEKFADYNEAIIRKDGRLFIDLGLIVRMKLSGLGVKDENIEISRECTFCEPNKYFSARRDKPEEIEAMLAYIGMKRIN